MKSTYKTQSPEETMHLGKQLAQQLQPGSVVLLFGDLGSGKTHFTKGIAKGLGVEGMIKSPTFTYMHSYQITAMNYELGAISKKTPSSQLIAPSPVFYHYDLYRLNPGDFYSIGLDDTLNDPQAINVIEWADRLGESLPKDHIRVDLISDSNFHEISIQFRDSEVVPKNRVEHFWDEWVTPVHVREHCKQVTNVALQVGQAFVDRQIIVDLNLLNTAALLHDMARVCDFKTMNREDFEENIIEEKWEKWMALREKYKGQNHPDIAFEALSKQGYGKTAELIRLHKATTILVEAEKFAHLETAILYYADKRVKHDEIVSIKERFHDGRERYGHYDNDDEEKLYLEVEKKTLALEEWLFSKIELKPEDIR